jgi:TPR repeat protein
MRSLVAMLFVLLVPAAMAQTTMITIPNSVCTNPAAPAAAAPSSTPSVAAGTVAALNRDFALALVNFKPLAEKGDADAQRAMGQLLMQNCTGLQDKNAAVEWLTKAAAAGNISAQNQMAFAYLRGFGVGQDDAKAFALFNQTATAGNALGESELGYLYLTGRGVPQDKYQGLQWTVKAAEQGNATALGNIAGAYIKGEVLARDTDLAAYFLVLANQRSTIEERNDLMETSQLVRAAVSAEVLSQEAKRAQRWNPGPGSLSDVLSDAEDYRRHHN